MEENAKEELLREVKDIAEIKCAILTGDPYDTNPKESTLKVGHTQTDLENFLESIDFTYYSGFGGQRLFGTVWLKDGTWLSRGEYDGSEWWEHNRLPEIPTKLK